MGDAALGWQEVIGGRLNQSTDSKVSYRNRGNGMVSASEFVLQDFRYRTKTFLMECVYSKISTYLAVCQWDSLDFQVVVGDPAFVFQVPLR